MSTTFGPVPTVTAKDGSIVAAKWLQDDVGNYILDPATMKPYLVPASFDLGAFINKYAAMGAFPGPAATAQTLLEFRANFPAGAVDDLQRSYNGLIDASPVMDFRPAASFILGVASKAAGLPDVAPVLGGGGYNAAKYAFDIFAKGSSTINIDGEYGNNPPNDTNIREGERFFDYLAQGIHIGFSPVTVNTTTQSVSNNYTASIAANIASGKAPDGSPVGVSMGDSNGAGQSIWIKDTTTGAFTKVVYKTSSTGGATTWEIGYSASGAMTNAKTMVTDAIGNTTVYGEGALGSPSSNPVSLTRDIDAVTSATSYVVQKGDTLWDLAQSDGVSLKDYLDANPQITHPNLINTGQVINRPSNATTPVDNTHLDLQTSLDPFGNPIQGSTGSEADGTDNHVLHDGFVDAYFTGGDLGDPNDNGANTNGQHNIAGGIVTDWWMPAAKQFSPNDRAGPV